MPLFRPRIRRPSSDNIEPCLPRLAKAPPTGPDWIHEIKHDGFRILARRDGPKVRLISRNGRNLTYRFPLAAAALAALPVHSCLIDGEAIVCDGKGLAVFQFIRNYRRGNIATICAFDLIEINGKDLSRQPIEDRKLELKKLLKSAHSGIALGSGGGRAATQFRQPAPAAIANRGKPRRAGRRWPVSTPGLRITGATASNGCCRDAPR